MARMAFSTAKALIDMYQEDFRTEGMELFRITWPQLRTVAGVAKLDQEYLTELVEALRAYKYVLVQFEDYFVVASEFDFMHDRTVPDSVVENYIVSEELEGDDDEMYEANEERTTAPRIHRPHYKWFKRNRRELHQMTSDEIIARFEEMGFKDPLGHRLENMADFENLVRMAKINN